MTRRTVCNNSYRQRNKQEQIFIDSSVEFIRVCEDFRWNHDESTPHRSETNGTAERAVRRVKKKGTASVVVHSGISDGWWSEAVESCCYLRHMQDTFADGGTQYEQRFNAPCDGPIWPLGARILYNTVSQKDKRGPHNFGKKKSVGWRGMPYTLEVDGQEICSSQMEKNL